MRSSMSAYCGSTAQESARPFAPDLVFALAASRISREPAVDPSFLK
jgi:hypothetical protein